ncbi:MAG: tautomerase family protein [Burkholderiales bacterium]|nr:tautomerase family protein [Burkholderiales bacterium]
MPTLTLKLAAPPDRERDQALATALTSITADTLGKRAEVTAVLIEELPAARWFIGAQPVQRPTALLEISITAGTNTAAQKAVFIEAAFAELQARLAPGASLEEASYVIVREVAATDWGYGGKTLKARQALREHAAL